MEPEERVKYFEKLERRIKKLELHSHPPIDWEKRIEYLEETYMKLYDLLTNKIKENQ